MTARRAFSDEEPASLADQYRRAAFDLLSAARRVDAAVTGLMATKSKVWEASEADLSAAVTLLNNGATDLADTRKVLTALAKRTQGVAS